MMMGSDRTANEIMIGGGVSDLDIQNQTGFGGPENLRQGSSHRTAADPKYGNKKFGKGAEAFNRIDIKDVRDLYPMNPEQEKPKENMDTSHNEKEKQKKAQYLLYSKPTTQMEASDDRKLSKLRDHIVVCGIHTSIHYLILPLRAKYLRNYLQDIVIINPSETVPKHIWDTISCF